jgi:gas vesicle protein
MSQHAPSFTGRMAVAFLIGAAAGAAITLLAAPESGADMRQRIRRSARAAQDELTGLAGETREALGAITQDARQTLRRTATRLNAALDATREAFKGEAIAQKTVKTNGRS